MNRLEAMVKLLLKANIFFIVSRLSLDYGLYQLYTKFHLEEDHYCPVQLTQNSCIKEPAVKANNKSRRKK